MIRVSLSVVIALLFSTAVSAEDRDSEHARKTLEIYTNIIAMETAKNLGNVPAMARYLADELIGAGLPQEDVEILAVGETAALIARYRGDGSSGGTDGMHFRNAGIPTWGMSGLFMNPDDNFAHGLNERVPIKAFYDALDHWSIIIKSLAK